MKSNKIGHTHIWILTNRRDYHAGDVLVDYVRCECGATGFRHLDSPVVYTWSQDRQEWITGAK